MLCRQLKRVETGKRRNDGVAIPNQVQRDESRSPTIIFDNQNCIAHRSSHDGTEKSWGAGLRLRRGWGSPMQLAGRAPLRLFGVSTRARFAERRCLTIAM